MGCNNSKIDNEEGLSRCKQRKHLMKQTVASRHNFAASHAMFVVSLKGVGSAFRQFAEGEVKDEVRYLMQSEVSTPRTQTLSFEPPPMFPADPSSPGFSPSPPHSPISPHVRHSALRMQDGSRGTGAVSSPESVIQEFLPPPPPPITIRQHRMEHTPSASITNIYRYPEESSNSYNYKMDDSIPPPPFQPILIDDDWRQSSRTTPISHAATRSNPTPPPPVTRSSWQDLFMDPFRPSPSTFNYMEDRKSQDVDIRLPSTAEEQKPRVESERKMNYDAEQKKIQQLEQRRHDMDQKKILDERRKSEGVEEKRSREHELRKGEEKAVPPPPNRIVEVKESIPDDIPDLEEDDVPDLEDIDEDIDEPAPKEQDNTRDSNDVNKPQPAQQLASEPISEENLEFASKPAEPEPATPKSAPEQEPEPETPPRTPPQTPPKVQEPPPKAANAGRVVKISTPGKTPGKPPKPEQSISKTNKELAVVKSEKGGRDLLDVLKEVDECFLRAADSGEDVSRILETKKAHYHSSFSDSLRVVGESARINLLKFSGKSGSTSFRTTGNMNSMSVLTDESPSIMSMRRNLSNMSSARYTEECGLGNSHAATLDRLLAWEKKLYLEVKEAEALRVELDRKYHLFRNQDAKNEDHTVIDKTRYTIKGLQTRMVVAIQAVDSASQQVQKLRDEELYPQLVELMNGLGTMWKGMSQAHQAQLRAVETMRRLDNSAACEPTISSHRQSTMFLEQALNKWSEGVSRVISSQMEYLKNLTSWLRLSLMQFGSEEMDNRSGSRSPSRSPSQDMTTAPIFRLCQRWEEMLSQLPHQVVLEGIGSFAAVVREMLRLQWEELRIKKRVENYQRELERREYALQTVSSKDPGPGYHEGFRYQAPPLRSPATTSGSDVDDGRLDLVLSTGFPERSEVGDRRLKFEATRRKLEAELEAERKAYTDTRAFTLNSLQAGLPQLFLGALAFTNSEVEIYDQLIAMGSLPNR